MTREPVAKRATEEHERTECEEVAVHDPRQARQPESEIARDGRQRDRGHGAFQKDSAGSEDRCGQDDSLRCGRRSAHGVNLPLIRAVAQLAASEDARVSIEKPALFSVTRRKPILPVMFPSLGRFSD